MLENSSQEVFFCVKNLQLSEGGKFVVATVNSIVPFLMEKSSRSFILFSYFQQRNHKHGPIDPAGDWAMSQAAEG